jgi:hypothetical protein
MDPILFPVLALGTMISIVIGAIVVGRTTMKGTPVVVRDWREVLLERGFRRVDVRGSERERWEGRLDGVAMTVVVRETGDSSYTEVEAELSGRWGAELAVKPNAGVGFSSLKDGFRTGDDGFDSLIATEGPVDVVPALLDRKTRESLEIGVVYSGFRVEAGAVYAWLTGNTDNPLPVCTALVGVVQCISFEGPLERKLVEVALDDSEPQRLRERCTHILFERHPSSPEAHRAALEVSRPAADESIRFAACMVLAASDTAPLRQFALGARRDSALRVRALEALRARNCLDDELLGEILRNGDAETASAAAVIARKERRSTLLEPLRAAALEPSRGGAAAAAALRELRDYGAAPALTRALSAIGDDMDVATPYVEALEELGGIDAIAALRALRPGFGGGAMRDRIARAVEAIQQRAGNPEAGRLAVVEDAGDGGQLSVVEPGSTRESGA